MPPSHEEVRSLILNAERRMRDTFEDQARRELALVDDASSLLAVVVGKLGEQTVKVHVDRAGVPSGDVETLKLIALKFIGVRALRVVRAARSALATGYEPEARSYDRILVELLEHRRAILEDESGKAALDWMKGKRGSGIGGRVAAMSPPDLYKHLSEDWHGDPNPVMRLIDGSNALEVGPVRTPATRASLLMHAGFCRDQAVAIADVAGITFNGLPRLDAAIRAAWVALGRENDSDA